MDKFVKNNWFKVIIACAIIIVALSIAYYFVSLLIRQKQISSTNSQEKCAAQAKKVFDTFKPLMGIDTYSYKDHYNSNGTCYILIHGFGEGGKQYILMNAYENKSIASCDFYVGAPQMSFCGYNLSSEKYDIDKFNNFVKPFMEN